MIKKQFWGILILVLCLPCLGFSPNEVRWQKVFTGLNEGEVRCVFASPGQDAWIFFGTRDAVYESTDAGKTFRRVISLISEEGDVRSVIALPTKQQEIYVLSRQSLLLRRMDGEWQKIFSLGREDEQCFSLAVSGKAIYVGTNHGLYRRPGDRDVWEHIDGVLRQKAIYKLLVREQNVYAVAANEVFRIREGDDRLQRVFAVARYDGEEEADEDTTTQSWFSRQIKDALIWEGPGVFFIATDQGVYRSQDDETWQALPLAGLPADKITALTAVSPIEMGEAIAQDKDTGHGTADSGDNPDPVGSRAAGREDVHLRASGPLLLLGTSQGAFAFWQDHWQSIVSGMDALQINHLSGFNGSTVYAATNFGLYRLLPRPVINTAALDDLELKFRDEPDIKTVQRWAIHYADVHPNKILSWKKAASRRAILPTFSAGIDRSATNLFHWDTGGSPDTLQKGRDFLEWDLTFSWKLDELIWNPDQTSIDSRAKLVAELREDILTQVTRIYFERRHLQQEMLLIPAEDPFLKLEKELRLQELTALLDGYTGGKFSQAVDERKEVSGRSSRYIYQEGRG